MRWSDLDAQGHVNNAKVVDFLQEARVAFLRSGPASALLDSGVVVVGHQVEYQRVIDYDTPVVQVEICVSALGAARIELAYELSQDGQLTGRARTVLCPFDFEQRRPVRLSPHHREFFAGYRRDTAPLRELSAPSLEGRGSPVELVVRWSDLDAYGHVNNAVVFDYLQQARVTATTAWAPAMARAGAHGSSYTWLIARQDVDYLAQIEHRMTPYEVRVAPIGLGTSSVTLAAEVLDPGNGNVFSRARTVLVCADGHGRKVELPDGLRHALADHVVDA